MSADSPRASRTRSRSRRCRSNRSIRFARAQRSRAPPGASDCARRAAHRSRRRSCRTSVCRSLVVPSCRPVVTAVVTRRYPSYPSYPSVSFHTGTPAIVSRPPKLVCTSTPTVHVDPVGRRATTCRCRLSSRTRSCPCRRRPRLRRPRPSFAEAIAWRDVVGCDMESTNVVQRPVIGFADQAVDRPHVFIAGLRHGPARHAVERGADRQRVGQDDRRFDRAEFVALECDPASLPNALPTNTAPGTLSRNTLPPCGTIAVTPVLTASPVDERDVPDANAADVRDGVQRAGRAGARRNSQIPRPRASIGRRSSSRPELLSQSPPRVSRACQPPLRPPGNGPIISRREFAVHQFASSRTHQIRLCHLRFPMRVPPSARGSWRFSASLWSRWSGPRGRCPRRSAPSGR